jgi:bidirectional [NiFe] hydrogenase diaphorase subunit
MHPVSSMLPYLEKCEPPSDDKRWKNVAATMRKLGNQRHALIEALHVVQQEFGYLDKAGLTFVAATLRLPLSQVYGTATFYQFFTMNKQGKHKCSVCTGSACYIKGSDELLKAIDSKYGVGPGETTADGSLTIETARCFGTCGLALVAVVDEEMTAFLTPDQLIRRLEEVRSHAG